MGVVAVLGAALVACGGGGGDAGESGFGTGTMRVALTDAPSCGYDAVNVTVEKVRVHKSSSAADSDGGWSEVVLSPAKRVDLLSLQNGVLSELGQTALPAGKYQQLRLVLAENSNAQPLANSVVPTGGTETALDTPSAQQSGLKMNVDLDVNADQLLDLVLDFDACKSVVRAGNSGHYKLKPVVRVIPRFVSGVSGVVAAGWPAATTQVSLQQDGVVVRATAPDNTGKFMLQPVAPGTYDLVIASPGQTTVVVTGVVVTADTVTALNAAAAAIAATASANGTAKGKVTTGATTIDASTRAVQTLSGGHTIELTAAPADSTTGDYSHTLPVAAPLVAPFVAAPGTLAFVADTAVAGKYSVQASALGATKTAGPFTLTSGGTSTNDFVFP
ncbi:DUF4382 domain-containing protein [Piscinibacter sp. XHJ-5]|uniref:DUF4382 domain-containing protein n=1 Tax=Piscinibacter sp. XHJ-5 TaxID=3037797 RepID=UPI00245299C4|nr:DUF4382 domain-containing protein [Piscinibacter sp. XHJ-5]